MQALAIASGKGGVGKTTTALELAAIYAAGGARVLVLDLDPQGSATAWIHGPDAADGLTVLDVMTGDAALQDLARPSSWPGVDLVSSAPALAAADRALAGQPLAVLGLRRAVQGAAGGPWAWILADCPPSLGLLTTAALAAAGGVLAAVEPMPLGLTGLADLEAVIGEVGAHVTPAPRLVGVLPCRVDGRLRLARVVLESLAARYGSLMLPTVRSTVKASEAAAAHQSLTTYDPTGGAAADYRAAAAEIQARMSDGNEADG